MPVCIGGMHRSGTSMVARLLNLCGLDLGPAQDMMLPSADNAEGFWENLRLVEINDRILNELGGAWDRPPAMPDGWTGREGVLPLKQEAREVVQGFSGDGPWGWKDPRNSLTLPFWMDLFPDARVVVCLRNPLEVAVSLKRRNDASYAYSLDLWKTYYFRMLASSSAENRVVTHYDAYFHDAHAQLRRLLDFLDMTVPESALDESLPAASEGMRHNSFTARQLRDYGVSRDVVDLYAGLCREAGWADDPDAGDFLEDSAGERREGETTDAAGPATGPMLSATGIKRLDKRVRQASPPDEERDVLRANLASRNAEIDALRSRLKEKETDKRVLEERLVASRRRLEMVLRRVFQEENPDPTLLLATLPLGATVAVAAGNGAQELPREGQDLRIWGFPHTGDAGWDDLPDSDTAAIAHLESLRSEGADHLLFLRPALGWLRRHKKFGGHLAARYRTIYRQDEACALFALRETAALSDGWRSRFEETISECETRLEREPTILDWRTGLRLEALFPKLAVFSSPDKTLPYLDGSIDVVTVLEPDAASADEARRVAKAAVITLAPSGTKTGTEAALTSETEWLAEKERAALRAASIIIPTYNGKDYTEACLAALMETLPPDFGGEVIVVDDASTDGTPEALERWTGPNSRVKVLRNPENAGFVESCNRGARAASGEIVVFLNNDTLPLPGWLAALLQTFRDHPEAGAVGGKLVYPDGTLQEAGGVIFSDASGANFGRGDPDPDAPLYCYVREVDYCSGALLATRRSLFEEVGGFDERYRPAYYEDTDYCFAVREKGFKVYYQPESVVVHLEGATSGTDLSSGVKRYQVVNKEKFVDKWAHRLKHHGPRPGRYDRGAWHALAFRHEAPPAMDRGA